MVDPFRRLPYSHHICRIGRSAARPGAPPIRIVWGNVGISPDSSVGDSGDTTVQQAALPKGRAMDRYEAALQEEIASLDRQVVELKVRRDALEHALIVYGQTRPVRVSHRAPSLRAGSQSAAVLDQILAAGTKGITTAQIYKWIEAQELSIRPGTVRSLLYEKKKAGILERTPEGRYRFKVPPAVNGADHGSKQELMALGKVDGLIKEEKDPLAIL